MHDALWYVVLVCHKCDVCKNYDGSVYVGLSESVLPRPVDYFVVGNSPSLLL